jgi:hypothetical protein
MSVRLERLGQLDPRAIRVMSVRLVLLDKMVQLVLLVPRAILVMLGLKAKSDQLARLGRKELLAKLDLLER